MFDFALFESILLVTSAVLIAALVVFVWWQIVGYRVKELWRSWRSLPLFWKVALSVIFGVFVLHGSIKSDGVGECRSDGGNLANVQQGCCGTLSTSNLQGSLRITGFDVDSVDRVVGFGASWRENLFDYTLSRNLFLYSSTNLLDRRWILLGSHLMPQGTNAFSFVVSSSSVDVASRLWFEGLLGGVAFFQFGLDIDSDNDGLIDSYERLCTLTDSANPDTDSDGISDGQEVSLGLDPFAPVDFSIDLDGDGLTHTQELALASNPLKADSDGDGLSDAVEYRYGRNPSWPGETNEVNVVWNSSGGSKWNFEYECYFFPEKPHLVITNNLWIGLDRTGNPDTPYVSSNVFAHAFMSPSNTPLSQVSWNYSGICDGRREENNALTLWVTNREVASALYRDQTIEATIDGTRAISDFTVVKVDVMIGNVGEDKEEIEGVFVPYVADAESGILTEEGIGSLMPVAITCQPNKLTNEVVAITAPIGFLYIKRNCEYIMVSTSTYEVQVSQLDNIEFFIHGHTASNFLQDREIIVEHKKSGAIDKAVFTNVKVERVQYKLGDLWKDVPEIGFTNVCMLSEIQLKVQPFPLGAHWPSGFPVWSGIIQEKGPEITVKFNLLGVNDIFVSCGVTKGVSAYVVNMLGDLNIGWNHTYSCDASSGDATTRARPFELIYTACADIRNNLWYLRISSITGGTEIAVHMGNYQTPNPGVNILTEEDGCMAIIDMLLESSSYGPARRWVTELAIKTHEEWHRDEWIENS